MARNVLLEFRRGTAAAWTSANPVLAAGEPGYETDTGKLKIGDGSTAWSSLAYFAGSGSGITALASPLATITVTNPAGPTADVDLPTTGVTAGSYGTSTQVPRITVDAEGRLTAASQVGIGGLPGSGLVLLYSSTLGVAGLLDTGAAGVPAGHQDLLVIACVQTNSGSTGAVFMQFNADAASTYTQRYAFDGGTSTTSLVGGISFAAIIPSNAGTALAIITALIPRYADTSIQKTVWGQCTNVSSRVSYGGGVWPSTAAISQISMGANTPASPAQFKAGCSMLIYGTQ